MALTPVPKKAPGEKKKPFLLMGANSEIKACEYNAKALMSTEAQYDALHLDNFLQRVRLGDRDWTDNDDRRALCWLQAEYGVAKFTLGQVRNAVLALAHERQRDSLMDYVNGLPQWDRVPRIELALCEVWGARDTLLTRAASRNLFIAMIARALKPGAQVDTLWVFEGPQGTLKSKSLRALGGHFHAEISAPVGTADFLRELIGLWLAELSELDNLHGREAGATKRILSSPSDRFVQKYEKHAVTYPRRSIAVGTTNEARYWMDPTGGRRLVPIRCGDIDLAMIENNREQWFAEARDLYEAGATWWEYPAEIEAAQEERQQVDPWEDLLRGLIANGRSMHIGTESVTGRPLIDTVPWPEGWMSSAAIMQEWLRLAPHQQGAASGVRLGRVMKRLGFRPLRQGKHRERGWEKDTQEAGNG